MILKLQSCWASRAYDRPSCETSTPPNDSSHSELSFGWSHTRHTVAARRDRSENSYIIAYMRSKAYVHVGLGDTQSTVCKLKKLGGLPTIHLSTDSTKLHLGVLLTE
jgi:hypothetical protein